MAPGIERHTGKGTGTVGVMLVVAEGVTAGVGLCELSVTSSPDRKKAAARPEPGDMPCVAVHVFTEHPDADHVAPEPSATERKASAPKFAFENVRTLTIAIVLDGSLFAMTMAYALAAPGSTAAGTRNEHAEKSTTVILAVERTAPKAAQVAMGPPPVGVLLVASAVHSDAVRAVGAAADPFVENDTFCRR
jgi:hypothetical protein